MSLRVHNIESDLSDDEQDILSGLAKRQKEVSPKFFYDQAGSELFERICSQPEYYPTRTEIGIMESNLDEISNLVGANASVIEFGSGSSVKTQLLLSQLDSPAAYVPVDISPEPLRHAAEDIDGKFPDIEVLPVCADFTQPFDLPTPNVMPERNLVYFPGSTIGNFQRDAAEQLLHVMRAEAKDDGALLIGVDLVKPTDILERAYNDAAGVTADFNLNLLKRLNREFAANFNPMAFRHEAVFDENESRIEMRLVSAKKQRFQVAGESFALEKDEYIVTEHSHKFSIEQFETMGHAAGFNLKSVWTDADDLFSVQYLEAT